jgi:hypothetical protein
MPQHRCWIASNESPKEGKKWLHLGNHATLLEKVIVDPTRVWWCPLTVGLGCSGVPPSALARHGPAEAAVGCCLDKRITAPAEIIEWAIDEHHK